jgi:hypothetical protein
MKTTTKYVLGGLAVVAAYELWTNRAAAGAAATAAYERVTGTAPPPQPPVAGFDMGAPGHHGGSRGPHRPGHSGGGGGSSVLFGPWGGGYDDDPYADALRYALALEQGRRLGR